MDDKHVKDLIENEKEWRRHVYHELKELKGKVDKNSKAITSVTTSISLVVSTAITALGKIFWRD